MNQRGTVVLSPRGPKVSPPRLTQKPPRKKGGGLAMWKGLLVILIAAGGSTLIIRASDTIKFDSKQQVAAVGSVKNERCPSDMTYVPTDKGGFCIDRYEVSASDGCRYLTPANQFQSSENIANPKCVGISEGGRSPWVFATLNQAMEVCAKVGKRLPTAGEWYRAGLGTPDQEGDNSVCGVGHVGQTEAEKTGSHGLCVSSYGVYDMIGNVWEWVDANVKEGRLADVELPTEGYVAGADSDGIPTKTSTSSATLFAEDYFFIDKTLARGMFRGGFWGMGEKAGLYAVNATTPAEFVGVAVGFRCVR